MSSVRTIKDLREALNVALGKQMGCGVAGSVDERCDEHRRVFSRAGYCTAASDIIAALMPVLEDYTNETDTTGCTCGYGGFHEELNVHCALVHQ